MQKVMIWTKQLSLIEIITNHFNHLHLDSTTDINQAYKFCDTAAYDLVIADYGPNKAQSLEFVEYLREYSFPTRSLLICEYLAQSTDRVKIYQSGGSDVLAHPFSPLELKQRITNLLSFVKVYPNHTICAGPVTLNPETGTLIIQDGKPTALRKKENAILACLLRHRPRVVTKTMLINYVWNSGEETPTDSTLDVYIRRLRIHLGEFHNMIKTSRGFGYYFAQ